MSLDVKYDKDKLWSTQVDDRKKIVGGNII